jgi:hypothetical protein
MKVGIDLTCITQGFDGGKDQVQGIRVNSCVTNG